MWLPTSLSCPGVTPEKLKRTPSLSGLDELIMGRDTDAHEQCFVFMLKVREAEELVREPQLCILIWYSTLATSLADCARVSDAAALWCVISVQHKGLTRLHHVRLQVGGNFPLYGCCWYVREMLHRAPYMARQRYRNCQAPFRQCMIAAPRCYCLLSHYPFFELHFRVSSCAHQAPAFPSLSGTC